jgi:hypothetical protein
MAGKEKENEKASEDLNPNAFPKPQESELGIELGVENNLPFAVPFSDGLSKKARQEKELYEILRSESEDQGPTVSQLVAMRRLDGQARALYRLLTLPIRAALSKSKFIPADGGEAEADFIDLQFNLPPAAGGMTVTFHKFMAQLLQGLFDGFAPFEQVYDYSTYGPLKGKYYLKKLGYRQPNTITVVETKDGHFDGFRQRAYVNGEAIDVFIPRERAFYFAAQEEENKYYGVSFFQSAFYHYDKKVKMYYIAHLAAQRAAVGTRVGTYPLNMSDIQKRSFAQNLSNLAIAQWMMVPEGTKVEMLKEGGSFAFLDYINHHNNQMSKSILANFFDEDTGAGPGDKTMVNFGAPGDTMFILMLRAIMDDIANSINHYIIPPLIDWNFDGGKYPTFQWSELTDEQKALINATFNTLASAETVSPEFTRELEKKMAEDMGLEIDWDEVEEREAADKEAENMVNGLDAEGKPLPKDAMGNPILPGQDNPDAALQAFEDQAAGAGSVVATPEEEEIAKLSGDGLLDMAADLLALARPTSGSYRTVRTQEGAKRFDVPIGQQIPTGAGRDEEGGQRKVTVERLMSLRAQFDEAKRAGNDAVAKKAMEALKTAVYNYSGSWSPATFIDVMNKLPKEN